MNESTANSRIAATAHIISDIFSPLMIPTYTTAIVLWYTILRFLPIGIKLWALAGTLFITAIVPALVIFILLRMGKVSDMSISNKSQRTLPYCASIACYIGAGCFMSSMQAPSWLVAFFYGAAIVSLLSLVITHWWKISAHTGGVGGMAAACYWLALHNLLAWPLLWISLSFAIVGAVAWARIYLSHHTPLQVLAGASMAFIVEFITLSIL